MLDYFPHPQISIENGRKLIEKATTGGVHEGVYFIEEASELTKEITKCIRGKPNLEGLTEEVAHVYLTLAHICIMYDVNSLEVQKKINEKYEAYGLPTVLFPETNPHKPKERLNFAERLKRAEAKQTEPATMGELLKMARTGPDNPVRATMDLLRHGVLYGDIPLPNTFKRAAEAAKGMEEAMKGVDPTKVCAPRHETMNQPIAPLEVKAPTPEEMADLLRDPENGQIVGGADMAGCAWDFTPPHAPGLDKDGFPLTCEET